MREVINLITSNTDKRKEVVLRVHLRLKNKHWYTGVCLDNFPTDYEIEKDINGCVDRVESITRYWDEYSEN